MPKFIILFILTLTGKAYAQKQNEAIGREKQMTVFSSPEFSAATVYTLQQNEVFLVNGDYDNNINWLQIEISCNSLCKVTAAKKNYCLTGYVPRSSTILIDSLPKYQVNDIGLKFNLLKADSASSTTHGNGSFGLEIPLSQSFVVYAMNLDWKGQGIKQESSLFDDLYNITFKEGTYLSFENNNFTTYNHQDFFFIKQKCADGAAFYEVTWVIRGGKIIQRLIDEI